MAGLIGFPWRSCTVLCMLATSAVALGRSQQARRCSGAPKAAAERKSGARAGWSCCCCRYASHLHDTLVRLAGDAEECVRREVAAALAPVAALLGRERWVLGAV